MQNELLNFSEASSHQKTAYAYEAGFNQIINKYRTRLFQATIGDVPGNRNKRIQIMTSNGTILVPKNHPMGQRPMGFSISPYFQEQMCRVGSKMVFIEAEEEFDRMLGISVTAKQIERVCHCYGQELEAIDWEMAYQDSVQLKMKLKPNDPVYSMVDGSMLLTREEGWKEIKLGRIFTGSDQIEVSHERGYITSSLYCAHLGGAPGFWEKFGEIVPNGCRLTFISDGARWIWNHIEEHYPESTQILDVFHCRQHLYDFAKIWFDEENQVTNFVSTMISQLYENQTEQFFKTLADMTSESKTKEKARMKLVQYLESNKERIKYGKFIAQGLIIGSGAIESAHRNIIQKRLKLSGQRWTIKGAQQIANLRVAYKSGQAYKIMKLINNQSLAA